MDLGTKVIGFRSWTIQDDGYLHSLGLPEQAWGRGVNEAVCKVARNHGRWASSLFDDMPSEMPKPCAESPGHGCECGLYAWHNCWTPSPGPFVNPGGEVQGLITAWGRMEVHNKGFRAQKAEILALAYNPNWVRSTIERVQAVARDYEIECIPVDRLKTFGAEHGQVVPVEERPAPEPPKPPAKNPYADLYAHQLALHQQMLAQPRLSQLQGLQQQQGAPQIGRRKWWKP